MCKLPCLSLYEMNKVLLFGFAVIIDGKAGKGVQQAAQQRIARLLHKTADEGARRHAGDSKL